MKLLMPEKSVGAGFVIFIPKKPWAGLVYLTTGRTVSTNREEGKRDIKRSNYCEDENSLVLGQAKLIVKLSTPSERGCAREE